MAKTIYVLNGPNLNSLGTREPEKYGRSTLTDVEKLCRKTAARYGLEVDFRQTAARASWSTGFTRPRRRRSPAS